MRVPGSGVTGLRRAMPIVGAADFGVMSRQVSPTLNDDGKRRLLRRRRVLAMTRSRSHCRSPWPGSANRRLIAWGPKADMAHYAPRSTDGRIWPRLGASDLNRRGKPVSFMMRAAFRKRNIGWSHTPEGCDGQQRPRGPASRLAVEDLISMVTPTVDGRACTPCEAVADQQHVTMRVSRARCRRVLGGQADKRVLPLQRLCPWTVLARVWFVSTWARLS